MDPEYVTGKINNRILELLLRRFVVRFLHRLENLNMLWSDKGLSRNDHKRYSSHLEVSILHRVAPIKVYLTIYDNLKSSYLK